MTALNNIKMHQIEKYWFDGKVTEKQNTYTTVSLSVNLSEKSSFQLGFSEKVLPSDIPHQKCNCIHIDKKY